MQIYCIVGYTVTISRDRKTPQRQLIPQNSYNCPYPASTGNNSVKKFQNLRRDHRDPDQPEIEWFFARHRTWTQCRGGLQPCQVSSRSDQKFSFIVLTLCVCGWV